MVEEENLFFFKTFPARFQFSLSDLWLFSGFVYFRIARPPARNQSNPNLKKKYLESPYFRLANIFEAPQSQTEPPKSRARGPR